MRYKLFLFMALICSLAFPSMAHADGIIIPNPPICRPCPPPPCPGPLPCPTSSSMNQLAIRSYKVTVTIQDQLAVTHIEQIFFNPNNWNVEGTYIFPLPLDAAISSFKLWIDNKPVEGQILDTAQARQKYMEIVNSLRDPALLEYIGRGAVQAHIFPIPSQGERRIELEYSQALTAQNGLVRYIFPLNIEKFSAWPLENVTVNIDIRDRSSIQAVYSPSHSISISRQGEHHVLAGYEGKDVLPDADFALYYSLGEAEAFHLLTFRDPTDNADADGFFLLLLAPRPDAVQQTIAKDVILVLDRSGSMEGEKFQQAQAALRYILQHLNPEDRFNAIAFSTGIEAFAGKLQPASETPQALAWVDRLNAQGSTDINLALLDAAAMTDRERPTYLIFLTDGLPTEGVVDSQKILDNLAGSAPKNLRIFPFGVGYDVDTFLLDSLSQAHHGRSTYVKPSERLDEVLSDFYTNISAPVMTDLTLNFGNISAYDLFPSPLPDLFAGSQIVVAGRYRQSGVATIQLSGQVNGQNQTFQFPDQNFAAASSANGQLSGAQNPLSSIPRLWATRKIGYLLNQIRLQGPDQETIDQVVKLSIRFGIVTPYTSYLVSESMPLGVSEQNRIAQQQYEQMQAMPSAAVSGSDAVQKAVGQGSLAQAEAPAALSGEDTNQVRILGARTFVRSGEKWVDTAFDPKTMQAVKVAFLSKDYFALAEGYPDLAAAFALGQSVIAIANGAAYEVVPADETVPSLQFTPPPASTPADNPTPNSGSIGPLVKPSTPASLPGSEQTPVVSAKSTNIPSTEVPGAMQCTGGFLLVIVSFAWLVFSLRR